MASSVTSRGLRARSGAMRTKPRVAHVLVERGGVAQGVEDKVERARDGVGCLCGLEDAEHCRGAAAAVPVDERRGRERDDPAGGDRGRRGGRRTSRGRAREREVAGRRVQQAVRAGDEHGAEVPAGRGAERRDGLHVGVAQQRVDGERPDVEAVCVGALVCPTATATSPARRTAASGHRPARRR